MVAAPTGTSEPHMGQSPHRANPNRSDSIRQKPDKPKTNIMKRVEGQK